MNYDPYNTTRTIAVGHGRLPLLCAVLLGYAFLPYAGWADLYNLSTQNTGGGSMIQGAFCGLKGMVSGTAALAMATLAVIIVGAGALTGKIQWSTAFITAVAIAVMLGVGSLIAVFSPQGDVCAQNNFAPANVSAGGGSAIQTVFCTVIGFISGTPGVALCMLGILGLGAMAMIGKLSWGTAITVGMGIAVIMGLSTIMTVLGFGNACALTPQNGQGSFGGLPSGCSGATAVLGMTSFVEPLVNCFTGIQGDNVTGGIIPTVTAAFLQVGQNYYFPLVQVLFTLAVALFGVKLLAGEVEHVKQTTFTLLFKIGGVLYFMSNAPYLYTQFLGVLYWLCDTIAAAAGAGSTDGLWSQWDTILGQIFGFAFTPNMAAIGAFLFLIMMSKGIGILIAAVGLYFLTGLFYTLVRFIHMFLMTILGFSFAFCLCYLFVPLILFKGSFEHFQRWLNLIISLIVTPVIIIGYMGMMMLAVNLVVFTGPLAIWSVVGAGCAGMSAGGGDVFAQATGVGCVVSNFKSLFFIDHANSTISSGSSGSSGSSSPDSSGNGFGANGQTCSQLQSSGNASAPSAPTASGSSGSVNCGVMGKACRLEGMPGSTYSSSGHPPGAANFGFEVHGLQQACADQNGYNVTVLLAFAAAALLMYVMYSLLDYIPVLAGELSSQGMDSFTSILGDHSQRQSMPGQKSVNQAISSMTGVGGGGAPGAGGAPQ